MFNEPPGGCPPTYQERRDTMYMIINTETNMPINTIAQHYMEAQHMATHYTKHTNMQHIITPHTHLYTHTTTKEHTMHSTTYTCPINCTCKGGTTTMPMPTMDTTYTHTCTPMCTCKGTYTNKEITMPTIYPTYQAYALLFTLCTIGVMVGYCMWAYIPITHMFNAWGFFLMWANALVGMPLCAHRFLSLYKAQA